MLIEAYLESKYQSLLPINPILRFFASIILSPVRCYFWLCSKRVAWLLRFSGWNHDQATEFKKLPPELKMAFIVQPTERELSQGILADDNVHQGAGLYEEVFSHHQAIIEKRSQR